MDPRLEPLREVYDRIPTMRCKGLCSECCTIIHMTDMEHEVLSSHMLFGRFPSWPEMSHRMLADDDYHCPLLVNERCSVYEDRPLICRLWGTVEGMKCPYGCVPEGGRFLTVQEGFDLLEAARQIGGGGGL